MLIVLGSVTCRPDTLAEVLRLGEEHVARSLKEPGCLAHAMHQAVGDPLRVVFVERWADLPSLGAHFKVPESVAFSRALHQLATEPPEMKVYEASELTLGAKAGAK